MGLLLKRHLPVLFSMFYLFFQSDELIGSEEAIGARNATLEMEEKFSPRIRMSGTTIRPKEAILVILALALLVFSIMLFYKHWSKNYRELNTLPYYAYLYKVRIRLYKCKIHILVGCLQKFAFQVVLSPAKLFRVQNNCWKAAKSINFSQEENRLNSNKTNVINSRPTGGHYSLNDLCIYGIVFLNA